MRSACPSRTAAASGCWWSTRFTTSTTTNAPRPELVRVVAPGGRLVVEEMNYERLPVKLVALGEKLLLMGSHFYRPAGLARLFEGRGARVSVVADDPMAMWVVVEKAG